MERSLRLELVLEIVQLIYGEMGLKSWIFRHLQLPNINLFRNIHSNAYSADMISVAFGHPCSD